MKEHQVYIIYNEQSKNSWCPKNNDQTKDAVAYERF